MLPPLDGLDRQTGVGFSDEARPASVDVGADATSGRPAPSTRHMVGGSRGEPLPDAPVIVVQKSAGWQSVISLAGRNIAARPQAGARRVARRYRRRSRAIFRDRTEFPEIQRRPRLLDGRSAAREAWLRRRAAGGRQRPVGSDPADASRRFRHLRGDARADPPCPARGPHRRGTPALSAGRRHRASGRHAAMAEAHARLLATAAAIFFLEPLLLLVLSHVASGRGWTGSGFPRSW